MFVKVHNAREIGSNNSASCMDLACYLSKEGDFFTGFFGQENGKSYSLPHVVSEIDSNKSALGKDDAKFFMISINPTHRELCGLIGREVDSNMALTDNDRRILSERLKEYARDCMDEYALQFDRETVRSGDDLLYFGRVETTRIYKFDDPEVLLGARKIGEEKQGLNWHVHVIVSRKSKDGKVKLSPNVDSKGNTWINGEGQEMRRGFNHLEWKQNCCDLFFSQYPRLFGGVQDKKSIIGVAKKDIEEEKQEVFNLFPKESEFRKVLEVYSFSSILQIREEMKQKGYDYNFQYGKHIYKKGDEHCSLTTQQMKLFERKPSNQIMRDISSRMNLFLYSDGNNSVGEGLSLVPLETTYKNKKGELVNTFVATIYDENTKTRVPLKTVQQISQKSNIITPHRNLEQLDVIKNEDLKELLPIIKSEKELYEKMSDRGYSYTYDNSTFLYDFQKENVRCFISKEAIKQTIHVNTLEKRVKPEITHSSILKMLSKQNKDLYEVLLRNKFSSLLQIPEVMKERGYKSIFHNGFFYFARGKEVTYLSVKHLKKFIQEIPDYTMRDISSRMNLFLYSDSNNSVGEGLSLSLVKYDFRNDEGKIIPRCVYMIHDKDTNSFVNLSSVIACQRENYTERTQILERLNSVENVHLKETLSTLRHYSSLSEEMNKKGYDVSYNEETKMYEFIHKKEGLKCGIHRSAVVQITASNRKKYWELRKEERMAIRGKGIEKRKIERRTLRAYRFTEQQIGKATGEQEKEVKVVKKTTIQAGLIAKDLVTKNPVIALRRMLTIGVRNLLDIDKSH